MKPAVTFIRLGKLGRLGNCLHQIAATVGIARLVDRPVVLPPWPYAPYFSIPEDWFAEWGDPRLSQAEDSVALACGLWPDPKPALRWVQYLQSPSLWAGAADEVRAIFQPSGRAQAVLDALPQPGPMDVAVHVRRTDYLTMPDHLPVLPAHWYRRAVSPLTTLLGWKHAHDLRLHVYGDDQEWAEAELLPTTAHRNDPVWSLRGYGSEDADEITDWCDLQMMARYRHHIIANSSYSWWAAWLSGDDHAVVPDPWYGPKIDVSSPALLSWPKVPRTRPDRWDSERQEWIEMPE